MKLEKPPEINSKYSIFAMIFMLSNRLQTIGDSFFEEISTKQWFVLLILFIMKDYSPTLNELSDAVGSSHQNVKQLILKLEKKGYVELGKDDEDARRLRIKVTAKAFELNNAYEEKSSIFIDSLFDGLKEEELDITNNVISALINKSERMKKDYVRED
jgi:DNA-binding MarR family transcriptional regulator